MTPSEIMTLADYKADTVNTGSLGKSDYAELYDDLMEARGECS